MRAQFADPLTRARGQLACLSAAGEPVSHRSKRINAVRPIGDPTLEYRRALQ
jgi:hypothetical protein